MKRVVLVRISSATIRRLFARKRAAGLRDIDDRVGEARRLHLGRPPAELDLSRHAVLREIALGDADQFRRDALALQSFTS